MAVALPLGSVAHADRPPTIAEMQRQIATAKQQLSDLQAQSETAAERYNAGRIALADAKRTVAAKQHTVAATKAKLAAMRSQVSGFAADMYKGGGTQSISLISGNTDPQTFVDRTAYTAHLSQQKSATLAALSAARHDADVAQRAAGQALTAQEAVVAQLAQDKKQVDAAATQEQQLLSQLQAKQAELIRQAEIAAAKARAARQAAAEAAARRAAAEARAQAAELARERAAAAAAQSSFDSSPSSDSGPSSDSSPSDSSGGSAPSGDAAAIAVEWAHRELGKPYVWAAAGPNAFDCSGLTMYVYAKAGVYLGHYTGSQFQAGRHVSRSDLRPGDLVFFGSPIHHVGIYIGGGDMIEAPHTGADVRIASIDRPDYAGAVRVVG